ncbi:hypothetical protein [Sphaerisporangium dianthi]|uniref:Uncharacterized protein n=1 Tax=Sphaerisporangium dianthi TaxID=1436120 RepID=A0ABV9CHQ9_9ACTN
MTVMLCLAFAGFGVGLISVSVQSRVLAFASLGALGLSTVLYVCLSVKWLRGRGRGRVESGARSAVGGTRWFFNWLP